MTIRSFFDNFEAQDLTEQLKIVPNLRTPLSDIGLFGPGEGVMTDSVVFEENSEVLGLLTDIRRGDAPQYGTNSDRKVRSYVIPYFKGADTVKVADVFKKTKYGSFSELETVAAAVERKMTLLKNTAILTDEVAKFKAVVGGQIYAPNGTVQHTSFYADYGVTQKVKDFVFTNTATDVGGAVKECVDHIQDNLLDGGVYSGAICLCSPEWFSALINHAKVQGAYTYYSSTQEPLRNRLGGDNIIYEEFRWKGVLFREIRGGYNGTRFIPANEAYFIPLGTTDMFKTYYAPSNKMDNLGFAGEEMYLWQRPNPNRESLDLELEMGHIHLVRRPQGIVKATMS